ncbi:glycosyltransferase family 31 protein [Xylariaceae sp. FL1651]|nr:glycosyltransferase family 31 protein [Xylariaceae sp. FL1651]
MFPYMHRRNTIMRLRISRLIKIIAFLIPIFLFIHLLHFYHTKILGLSLRHTPLACPNSPLLNDVLVVVRTGATEVLQKLPIHFSTVLTCVPDYIIYSDLEEDVEGHHIVDVLDRISQDVKMNTPEFWLYNRLRASGRDRLEYRTSFGSGPAGALDNPGWKLDKWKFLPMVFRALEYRPDAKWFVFIEPDTYMFWHNMLQFLSRFDPNKPYYLGKHMYIGKVLFGHGGSGFMISNPAMKMVSKHWTENQNWFDDYTAKEWAGDMILGKAMENIGVQLISPSPYIQTDSLSTLDWIINKHDKPPWCYAPLTFHHMTEHEFPILWQSEHKWLRRNEGSTTLQLRDIFESIIKPRLHSQLADWDNQSRDAVYTNEAVAKLSDADRAAVTQTERDAQISSEHCQAACESKPSCMQFFYIPGQCFLSNELRLGHAVESQCVEYSHIKGKCVKMQDVEGLQAGYEKASSVKSGWIMDRVWEASKEMDKACQSLR